MSENSYNFEIGSRTASLIDKIEEQKNQDLKGSQKLDKDDSFTVEKDDSIKDEKDDPFKEER